MPLYLAWTYLPGCPQKTSVLIICKFMLCSCHCYLFLKLFCVSKYMLGLCFLALYTQTFWLLAERVKVFFYLLFKFCCISQNNGYSPAVLDWSRYFFLSVVTVFCICFIDGVFVCNKDSTEGYGWGGWGSAFNCLSEKKDK